MSDPLSSLMIVHQSPLTPGTGSSVLAAARRLASTGAVCVITKPGCQQCKATERWLTKRSVQFAVYTVRPEGSWAQELREAGWKQLPIVVTSSSSWSGYRPERLESVLS